MDCMGIRSEVAVYTLSRGHSDVGRWDGDRESFEVNVEIEGTFCMTIVYAWEDGDLCIKAKNIRQELLKNTVDMELVAKATAWIVNEFDTMGDMELWPDVFWVWENGEAVTEKFPTIEI